MIKRYLVFTSVILFFLTTGSARKESATPYGLMVEFIREPSGVLIMDLRPEFTWIVPAGMGMQKAYQLIISSDRNNAGTNTGDVWDSGLKNSTISAEVEAGITLKPNTKYFWKVRIRNEKNILSGYSDIQAFTTGDPKDYKTTTNRFVYSINRPQRSSWLPDGCILYDFGRDAFGTLFVHYSVQNKDTLIVRLGEKLTAEGRIDRNPGGSIRYQETRLPVSPGKSEYVLSLVPDKRNTGAAAIKLPDSLGVVTPFRYAEFADLPEGNQPVAVFQRALSYYFDDNAASFASSDTLLNHIWDICKYSIRATSFAGIYVDGDRERIPYEADAYINQLGHYFTDREYSMGRATNEYFIKHPTWPTEWILHTVLLFHNDLMFTGNVESLREYYDELRHKALSALAREDGLISVKNVTDEIMTNLGFSNPKERIRDIVDWPPAQKDTGWKLAGPDGERDGYDMVEVNTVVNAFYYRNLVLMADIAERLGYPSDRDFYRREAEKVRLTFNEKLLDKNKGVYTDGEGSEHSSLHANMMALAFDLVPEEYMRSVISFIKSRGMACSVYGAQYLLEGLYRAGEGDYALSLLTATHDRSWWNMIRSGSTITMEAWDMKYKPNSDWNHAWGAAPASIIPGYMWGIAPAEPGFAKCIIRPQLGSLKHSRITVLTIRGPITAEFREKRRSKEYRISIPGNMECDFISPEGKTIRLSPGKNKIVL
ncbi:MAG: family 78 glycoside hydrolase catalytic domain [Bacteroidales bacterium]|nr:family 78 glycoside hydrolase catalytic domain [Bacteroidales bacterium]